MTTLSPSARQEIRAQIRRLESKKWKWVKRTPQTYEACAVEWSDPGGLCWIRGEARSAINAASIRLYGLAVQSLNDRKGSRKSQVIRVLKAALGEP